MGALRIHEHAPVKSNLQIKARMPPGCMECDASNMDVTTEVLLCLHQMEGKAGKH